MQTKIQIIFILWCFATRKNYFADKNRLKIARTFIDSGYNTRNVYEFCRMNFSRGVFPIKGKGGSGLPLISSYSYPRGSGVVLIVLGVNDGKADVMASLQSDKYHFPTDDIFINPRGYDSIYFKQLLSEERVIKKYGGVAYISWETIKTQARNESLDLAVYNLAAVKSLNPTFDKKISPAIEVQPAEIKKSTPKRISQSRINLF